MGGSICGFVCVVPLCVVCAASVFPVAATTTTTMHSRCPPFASMPPHPSFTSFRDITNAPIHHTSLPSITHFCLCHPSHIFAFAMSTHSRCQPKAHHPSQPTTTQIGTMTATKEQKRQARANKKRKLVEFQSNLTPKPLELTPPDGSLQTPIKPTFLGTKTDCGGHQKALAFVPQSTPPNFKLEIDQTHHNQLPLCHGLVAPKVGMLSIGLAHDGDWKALSKIAGNGIKTMCDNSQKHIKFLEVVRDMLSALVNPSLAVLMNKTPRVTIMRGARTLGHTDSFR